MCIRDRRKQSQEISEKVSNLELEKLKLKPKEKQSYHDLNIELQSLDEKTRHSAGDEILNKFLPQLTPKFSEYYVQYMSLKPGAQFKLNGIEVSSTKTHITCGKDQYDRSELQNASKLMKAMIKSGVYLPPNIRAAREYVKELFDKNFVIENGKWVLKNLEVQQASNSHKTPEDIVKEKFDKALLALGEKKLIQYMSEPHNCLGFWESVCHFLNKIGRLLGLGYDFSTKEVIETLNQGIYHGSNTMTDSRSSRFTDMLKEETKAETKTSIATTP